MKNVRSSQPCISMNFFSKAQVLPLSIVNDVKEFSLSHVIIGGIGVNQNTIETVEKKST